MKPSPSENRPLTWTSPFEELLSHQAAPLEGGGNPTHGGQPNPVFGTPGTDAAYWDGRQALPDDCAVKCQQFILEQFTGRHVDEGVLVHEAVEHGWYAPGQGTTPADLGNLLELHGVAVTHYDHANQFQLALELAQGHKVMVGVESGVLWHPDPILEDLRDLLGARGFADHAVVVSGIDTSDPRHVLVEVSDPGTGQALATYPLEQFLDAWRGSQFSMVATQDPAPAHLPAMAHFDYGLGHIPALADVPYEHFLQYSGHPAAWPEVVHHYVEVHHDVHVYHHFDDLAGGGPHVGDPDGVNPAGHHPDPAADLHQPEGVPDPFDPAHHHPDPYDLLSGTDGTSTGSGHDDVTGGHPAHDSGPHGAT